ncbi:MAG: hypothetical protein IM671_13755 [Phenylobacterium sp.]|uniref:hypothetical protein n=1 Tax=Phenylobacterium sp. TaxID=1871053 RepID=UPI0025D66ECF|nr:hypothetical protein [Phenylobacterium sp.]MCA6247774.1 hypothetical protein [Phenylobacterium sp.]MCA6253982.1 hypothetical protein [Phenylobacterium sp.]
MEPHRNSLLGSYTSDEISSEIMSFCYLSVGWHYGRGGPIKWRTALYSLHIIAKMRKAGIVSFEVFPSVDRGILISGYKDDICVDLYLHMNNTFDIVVEKDREEVIALDNVLDLGIIDRLGHTDWLEADSSDSFTQNISATRRIGLPHSHSNLQVLTEQFRLYSSPASLNLAPPSATTLNPITKAPYQVIQLYSGDSKDLSCPQAA